MYNKVKKLIKSIPGITFFHIVFRNIRARLLGPTKIFSRIYKNNLWKDHDSASGGGSNFLATEKLRAHLPNLLIKYNVKTLVDAPCGDYFWMSKTNLSLDKYIGIDIVEELIEKNRKQFENQKTVFQLKDIINNNLPNADMVLCRDCLVHLPDDLIKKVLLNFKRSNISWLLMTTYPEIEKNINIRLGAWRPINFELGPFNLLTPITIIPDNIEEEGMSKSKSMGLWKIDDIVL